VGAAKAIAVSSNGFSKKAIRHAARYDIDLRTVAEVTDGDIEGWADLVPCEMETVGTQLQSITVKLFGENAHLTKEALAWIQEGIDKDGLDAPFLVRCTDNSLRSFLDFVRDKPAPTVISPPRPGETIHAEIPPRSALRIGDTGLPSLFGADELVLDEPKPMFATIEFAPGEALIRHNGVEFPVHIVLVLYEIAAVKKSPLDRKLLQYDSPDRRVADVHQQSATIEGHRVHVLRHRDASPGQAPTANRARRKPRKKRRR
jgi:hypothetical protein